MIGARGVAINVLAFLGNVALARLLVPADFGTIALGLGVLRFASLLSDGGLGAGLIRRAEHPTREELRSLVALQIATTLLLVFAVGGAGLTLGGPLEVIALMMCALPLQTLRAAGMITLQRDLNFRPVAAVEVAEVLAYYASGVAAVAAGLGVWGLAAASIVKAAVGTGILLRLAPVGLLLPLPSAQRIRPLLRFGLRFQGVALLSSVRDDGINVGIALAGSLATVGLWAIVWRLVQVPFLLLDAMWRVSFPAMAQLIGAGEHPAPVMRRVVALSAVATGVVLTALTSASPALIPALFGERWEGAVAAVPLVSGALQISGPVSVATAGYLFASDQAGIVLRAAGVQVLIWFGISLPLLGALGVRAVAIGFCLACLAETLLFSRAIRARAGIGLVAPLLAPFVVFAVAAAIGWFIAHALGPTLPSAVVAGAVGVGLYLAGMFILRRALLSELVLLGRRAFTRGTQPET